MLDILSKYALYLIMLFFNIYLSSKPKMYFEKNILEQFFKSEQLNRQIEVVVVIAKVLS